MGRGACRNLGEEARRQRRRTRERSGRRPDRVHRSPRRRGADASIHRLAGCGESRPIRQLMSAVGGGGGGGGGGDSRAGCGKSPSCADAARSAAGEGCGEGSPSPAKAGGTDRASDSGRHPVGKAPRIRPDDEVPISSRTDSPCGALYPQAAEGYVDGAESRRAATESVDSHRCVAAQQGGSVLREVERTAGRGGFRRVCRGGLRRVLRAGSGAARVWCRGFTSGCCWWACFEGCDSERQIAWRLSDSLSLRRFLGLVLTDRCPDHSTLSKTRRRISSEAHGEVFGWVSKRLGDAGLLPGRTVGIDGTMLQANASMRGIVRRDTGDGYQEYLRRLARESGTRTPSREDLQRFDRKRKKKTSNEEWTQPVDPSARVARMKDGRTRMAHEVEHAVGPGERGAGGGGGPAGGPGGHTDAGSGRWRVRTKELESAGAKPKGAREVVGDEGYHGAMRR